MRFDQKSAVALQLIPGGFPMPNSHGVYADATADRLEWRDPANHKNYCQIRVMQISEGWIMATLAKPPAGAGWFDPLTARWLYFSREDALAGAVLRVREKLADLEQWCFGNGRIDLWLIGVRGWLDSLEQHGHGHLREVQFS